MAITKSDGKFFRHLSHGAVILKLRSPAFAALTAALTSALLFSGCNPEAAEKVDQLTVFSGGGQYALPGGDFAKPLIVLANGPIRRGWFGEEQERAPVSRARLTAEVLPGSSLKVTPDGCVTDPGGAARFTVQAGNDVGDHYLRITPENAPDKAVTVRFTVGAGIAGNDQEVGVNEVAPKPLTLTLVHDDGKPAVGIPVYFKVLSSPGTGTSGAAIMPGMVKTDENGAAGVHVKAGTEGGEYTIGIEAADPEQGYFMRQLTVTLLAVDLWKVLINVLGGLALFIFGMKLMSDGLIKIAGDRMKKILQFFSRNGVVAVLAGTAVTAVIQSSSATTVMVIGFINAGLLNLTQAIGIILGANIGTTVTAQIISFDLGALAMPAITIGLIGTFAAKRGVRGWGESIFGFGLIFYGIGLMSSELKVLGILPTFQSFFQMFNCAPTHPGGLMPLLPMLGAIVIGSVLTVVVQSSSAAIGIVLALASGGLINFYTSVPLVLGCNIGTTVTAFLAAITANRIAKQAALSHFLSKTIGAVAMVITFYIPWGEDRTPVYLALMNAMTPGDVFAEIPQNIERHIAMAHTFFNIANTVMFLPFLKPFAHLCEKLIPPRPEGPKTTLLEPHLLGTPTAALEQVVLAIRNMVHDSWRMIDAAVNEHFVKCHVSRKAFDELAESEEKIDRMQADVTDYLVKIMRKRNLTEHQSELIPLLMHCTNDAERIADHTENIIALTERLAKSDKKLSAASLKAVEKVWRILDHQASSVLWALGTTDDTEVKAALKSERKVNRLTAEFEEENIERLRKGSCSPVNSVIFIEFLGELEKLGDHLSNIAERTPEIQKHYLNLSK